MKKYLTILSAIALFACNTMKKTDTDPRFYGAWSLPIIDNVSKNVIDTMTMTFRNDGSILYEVDGPFDYANGETKQKHEYTGKYYLSGDYLVTIEDDGKEVKAKYRFEGDDKLLIYFDGNTQTLSRIK